MGHMVKTGVYEEATVLGIEAIKMSLLKIKM
jgi:hypothetical protein